MPECFFFLSCSKTGFVIAQYLPEIVSYRIVNFFPPPGKLIISSFGLKTNVLESSTVSIAAILPFVQLSTRITSTNLPLGAITTFPSTHCFTTSFLSNHSESNAIPFVETQLSAFIRLESIGADITNARGTSPLTPVSIARQIRPLYITTGTGAVLNFPHLITPSERESLGNVHEIPPSSERRIITFREFPPQPSVPIE